MYVRFLLLIYLSLGISSIISAQQIPANQKKDTAKVYRDIEKYSKKRGFTGFIYNLFFKPVGSSTSKQSINKKKKLQKPYASFEGKIIRNIEVTTLDPFGYSVSDTTVVVQKGILNTANKLHLKTQVITIKNLLMIHKNQPFDSLVVNESERLIRSQKYVREVAFDVVPAKKNSDSVDIFIRVLDLWSLIPAFAASPTRLTVGLKDRNFLGLGHDFENIYMWDHSNGNNTFNSDYSIPNIRNTYINTSLHYGIDEERNYIKNIKVERPYFSPFAKWAGGMYLEQRSQKGNIIPGDTIFHLPDTRFNTQDFWGSTAFQLFKGYSENERTTNLILGLRYLRIQFIDKPENIIDSLQLYSNENFYLAGIGISTRKYIKDKYIFNYGIIEDVPVGKVYGITGGYQVKDNRGRLYLGLRFSYGSYINWGFISSDIEYGTFFRNSQLEQSVFVAGVNYFTNLFEIGNWKFRQFIKPKLMLGYHRIFTDQISINNENGIAGFNSELLTGTKKIVLTLQSQSYAPWNVLGFRFGPYLIYSLGMLGDDQNGFQRSRVYSQVGVGFLIKNEFLVYNIIQISIAFYPLMPGVGDNLIKVNPIRTTDFGFQTYELGKPETVIYK